ncbi:Uncharacterised protein [Mycobacteroides abscessus subsp. abscessus]|nr:Uncharacterised protein [Mycobacteroides abscessus subsp. abscessus]
MQDGKAAQIAHGHIALDSFSGLLAGLGGENTVREQERVDRLGRQLVRKPDRLVHRRQIGLDEPQPLCSGAAEGAADHGDPGADLERLLGDCLSQTVGPADDGEVLAGQIEFGERKRMDIHLTVTYAGQRFQGHRGHFGAFRLWVIASCVRLILIGLYPVYRIRCCYLRHNG